MINIITQSVIIHQFCQLYDCCTGPPELARSSRWQAPTRRLYAVESQYFDGFPSQRITPQRCQPRDAAAVVSLAFFDPGVANVVAAADFPESRRRDGNTDVVVSCDHLYVGWVWGGRIADDGDCRWDAVACCTYSYNYYAILPQLRDVHADWFTSCRSQLPVYNYANSHTQLFILRIYVYVCTSEMNSA